MIGPRPSVPEEAAPGRLPERERRGARISSSDMVMACRERASAAEVAAACRRARPQVCAAAGCGSATYLCTSQDEITAGTNPTRPYRMNCTAPESGPREL